MISGKKHKTTDLISAAIIVPSLIAILIAKWPWIGLILLLLILSWIIARLGLQYALMTGMAMLLPFSFETAITENSTLLIPTEPLIFVALFSMGWEILYKPGLVKQLFQQESRWILPLLACYVITALFSSMFRVSVKFSVLNISYILVFFIWQKHWFCKRPDLFPKLLILYSLSISAVVVYAAWRYEQYEWNPVTIKGVFSPFYRDNTIFGAASAIIAVFWMVYAHYTAGKTSRMLYFLTGAFFLAGVFFSNSRAAILSILFSGMVLLLALLRVRLKTVIWVIFAAALTVTGMRERIMGLLIENTNLSHTPYGNFSEQIRSSGNISTDISNMERLNRWAAGIGMFADRPVTGFGPGTFQFAYIPYQRPEFRNSLTVSDPWHIPENSGGTAHSEYILILSEMGIAGMIALFLFMGRLILIYFEKARGGPDRYVVIIACCALSTYFIHAFFNNFLNTDKFAFLFWGMAAWMISNYENAVNAEPGLL